MRCLCLCVFLSSLDIIEIYFSPSFFRFKTNLYPSSVNESRTHNLNGVTLMVFAFHLPFHRLQPIRIMCTIFYSLSLPLSLTHSRSISGISTQCRSLPVVCQSFNKLFLRCNDNNRLDLACRHFASCPFTNVIFVYLNLIDSHSNTIDSPFASLLFVFAECWIRFRFQASKFSFCQVPFFRLNLAMLLVNMNLYGMCICLYEWCWMTQSCKIQLVFFCLLIIGNVMVWFEYQSFLLNLW